MQPIDAEALFAEDPATDFGLGGDEFARSGTGLEGGAQVSPASTSGAISGFGLPSLAETPGSMHPERMATVTSSRDHAARAFANAQPGFGQAPLPGQPRSLANQATLAAPGATASAQLNTASPPKSQPLRAPLFGQAQNPAPGGNQGSTVSPVAAGVFGLSSTTTDVHQSVEGDPRQADGSESTQGPPREEAGLSVAQESRVIALPDVPMPTNFDSTQVDAVPPRPDSVAQSFGSPAASIGIRQLSGSASGSLSQSFRASTSGTSFPETTSAPAETEGKSPALRLTDLDGETGLELDPGLSATVRRSHTEDVPSKPVTQQIDPLVEFHDVFQDIRKAETGDGRSASERYSDTVLFSGVEERSVESQEKAQREREDREARAREGRLNLRAGAGGLAARIEKEVATPEFEAEDDDLLAAALADSGLREPSMDAEQADSAAVVDLDVVGESAAAPAFPNAARYLSVVLVLLLALMSVLGFIAMRNDGVLDLRDMGQMMGVAFQGEAYEPRYRSVIQIVQTAEGWVEEPLDTAPANDGNTLAVGDVVSGQYEATHGAVFTLIDGTITNTGDAAYRAISVEVRLVDAAGEAVATRVIPAGAPLDQPRMEEITDEESLEAEYARLGGLVHDTPVDPAGTTAFSGAFLLEPDVDVSGLTAAARVVQAERPRETWGAVEFSTPDAAALPVEETE